jgi:hypothetical protein
MCLLNVFSEACPFGIPKIQLIQLILSRPVILPEFESKLFNGKNKPVLQFEETGLFFVPKKIIRQGD